LAASLAMASQCPSATASAVLKDARRLLLVTSPGWNNHRARLRLYERLSENDDWRAKGAWRAAVIGRSGLAWGWSYQSLRRPGEPVKREGDGRTPAGAHRLGTAFGFEPRPTMPYLQLKSSTVCVDDPGSRYYNTIIDADQVPNDWTSAEKMREIEVYKIGFVVDYLSDRASRAGSCIFAHIWNGPESGTAGCLAAPEAVIENLQKILKPADAIAFLPEEELASWQGCWKGAAPARAAPRDDVSRDDVY